MNAHIPWNCTGQQKKAMLDEIRRQEQQMIAESEKNVDVAVLWSLHTLCGFGPKRLKEFFDGFNQIYAELVKQYDMESDLPWVYDRKLKEIGADVEEWRKRS